MIGRERHGFICEIGIRFGLVCVAVEFVDLDFLIDEHVGCSPLLLRHYAGWFVDDLGLKVRLDVEVLG